MARSRKSGLNQVFAYYKHECYRRNKYWGLDLVEFGALVTLPCHYCKRPPANTGRSLNGFRYSGLDRKDNSKGYHPLNVVPCCGACNSVKGQHLSYEEMLAAMRAVLRIRGRS